MSTPEPEQTRWGLLLVGLAIAGGIVWFEWSSRESSNTGIVEAITSNRTASTPSGNRRDFMADLSARGVASAINPVAAIPKTLLTDTIKRPLFTATRRQPITPPPAAIQPPPPPPPPDPKALQLIGVVLAKEGAVALVRLRGQRNSRSVRKGDIIAGWKIEDISPRDMRVRKGKVEATIGVSSGKPRRGVGQRSITPNISRANNSPDGSLGFNPNAQPRPPRQHQVPASEQDQYRPALPTGVNQPGNNKQPNSER